MVENNENESKLVPPISEGDIIRDQEVINNGKKEDGVVKYENFIIFVNNCKKGDIVSFQIEKVLPKFGIGKKIDKDSEEDE